MINLKNLQDMTKYLNLQFESFVVFNLKKDIKFITFVNSRNKRKRHKFNNNKYCNEQRKEDQNKSKQFKFIQD